jgi:phage baseplate assembly protein V
MSQARTLAELERTRANLIQVFVVAEADYAAARVRVLMGGLTSAWLPWTTARAGGDRTWAAPEVGEQVLIACPDGEPASGVVLGAIYQAAHAAPADDPDLTRTVYSDGAVVEYDRAAHAMTITLPSGGTLDITAPGGVTVTATDGVVVNAPGDVTITAPLTKIIGNLELTGVLTTGTGAGGGGTINGDLHIIGGLDTTLDVVADTISLQEHVHDGVSPGPGNTGKPVPEL